MITDIRYKSTIPILASDKYYRRKRYNNVISNEKQMNSKFHYLYRKITWKSHVDTHYGRLD